ncbi:hypothetical protein [uncultured Kriegella sp.]|uniref:hypothetical protein n=1 Tax=uncultured Kriegella sp. TaxID=1798910 RepID=UPI0030D846EA|tara:strand:+ start:22696 stop:23550 length:855 start_codon:yes stop_codon:yes gene_type:complete
MKSEFRKTVVLGYLLLLIINVVEFRSGAVLALTQLVLGLIVFLPEVVTIAFLDKTSVYRTIFKLGYLSSILGGMYFKWYNAPNHLYLFFFLSLLILNTDDEHLFKENLRWIFVIVMGFATVHKLLNPNFLSGDFIALRVLSGDFFRPLLMSGAFSGISESLTHNAAKISDFLLKEPSSVDGVTLDSGTLPFLVLKQPFVYSIIGMEFLLTLLFAFFSRHKFTLVFLLVFVGSIGLVVSEFEFAATLLFMGLIMCSDDFGAIKRLFKLTFLLYAILSILNNILWI